MSKKLIFLFAITMILQQSNAQQNFSSRIMKSNKIKDLMDDTDFKNEIALLQSDECAIIMFSTTWLGHGKKFQALFEKLSDEVEKTKLFYIDGDAFDENEQFKVKSLPAFLFFQNGKLINQIEGADEAQFNNTIKNLKKEQICY